MKTIQLLVIIASTIFIPNVFSIKCFQCSSFTDPECADILANDTSSKFLKECDQINGKDAYFCRKIVQTILFEPRFTRITRGCGNLYFKKNETYCKTADTDFKKERSCQCFTEACNSAPQGITTQKSQFLLIFPLIFTSLLVLAN